MAHGVPIYDHGVLPTIQVGGTHQVEALTAKIVEKLTEYQSNGEQAWELAEDLGGSYSGDKVFHSVGDRSLGAGANKGDTDVWIRINHYSIDDIRVQAYQDWSPTSSSGYRETFSGGFAPNVGDYPAIFWWSVVNEYSIVFIFNQGGSWRLMRAGQVIRPVSDKLNGVARITSQSGTGNGVVLGLDRDISNNIQPGQIIWLVNQTPDGVALQSVAIDLVTVVSITASQMIVDGVVNTYAVGSLAGIDPMPTYANNATNLSGFYFVNGMSGLHTGPTGQVGTGFNPGLDMTREDQFDPGIDGLYRGFQPYVKMGVNPQGFRGKLEHMRFFTYGGQGDKDLMRIDLDDLQKWKAFTPGGLTMQSGWVFAIGPGAS